MDGLWVLLLLIFTAALPVLLVYVWFKAANIPLSRRWFLLALLAGALSLPLAALMQHFLPLPGGYWGIFIRIALTEELSRLLMVFILFRLKKPAPGAKTGAARGAAVGLLAGLGFALVENAYYGAANIGITLVRSFTAAPLHGACGARIGQAAEAIRKAPVRALVRFLSAVAIHGMYNFMIVSPGIAPIFPVLVALFALAASVQAIHRT
ncbi:hypothetical protein AGMMS49928_29830 [Spirochaetia bacterium]|nr:hypothetical protein AGMMS49928_29830 [Spirochaetia bacterium]